MSVDDAAAADVELDEAGRPIHLGLLDASFDVAVRDGDAMAWCPTDPAARPNDGLVEEPGAGGCPKGMARVSTFCVDRFEASLVIVEGSTEKSWSPYYPPPEGKTYRAVSLRSAIPQGYISGAQAERACKASGKRLCTNDEWLRACRGPASLTYPYGNTRRPGVCNDARATHPAAQCFGTTASWIYSRLDYPGINQQADTVERTGSLPECVTAEGLFDMMGNLHEWIADPTIDFRGGFYADTKINGEGCLYRTSAHSFTHWDYSTGFRCCAG
jgi:formylglycine-generating enzyme